MANPTPAKAETKSESSAFAASMVVRGLQWLFREAPGAYSAISALVKKDPTEADFDAAIAQVEADSYRKLVPNSRLPEDA